MNKRIFLFSSLLLLAIGGRLFFLHIGDWLSVPEDPKIADIIICLNGDPDRVPKAVELFKQGYADKILVTHVETRKLITAYDVPDEAVLSLNSKPESTYEEALHTIEFMHRQNVHSAIIVSDPYHMYRAKWTYDHLLDTSTIQLTYTTSEPVQAGKSWWKDKKSRRFVLREIPRIPYYWIAHGLLGIKHDPQWVIVIEQWYENILKHFA